MYWAILGFGGLYWTVLGCTARYWALLGGTGLYTAVPGCGGVGLMSLQMIHEAYLPVYICDPNFSCGLTEPHPATDGDP